MRRIKTALSKMPRWARTALNLCLAAAALFAWYIFRGCPALSAEMAFRREEKARNVGPGEILCELTVPGPDSNRCIAAKTAFGAEVFSFREKRYGEGILNYVPRGENGLTLCGAGSHSLISSFAGEMNYPLVLFDEYPEAVRAELDLHLYTGYNGDYYAYDYPLCAAREYEGCFVFMLHAENEDGGRLGAQGVAIDDLMGVFTDWGDSYSTDITAEIRLLDESGNALCEQETELASVSVHDGE